MPPRPGGPAPAGVGASPAAARTPPEFPAWFGRPLRAPRAVSGQGRAVAILLDFPDRQAGAASRPVSAYRNLLFSRGTHATGSFRDYYLEQSYGTYDVTGEAYGWYRTGSTYASNFDDGSHGLTSGGRKIAQAAISKADPFVDFGLFDSDGPDGIPNSGDDDGIVDAYFVFHAGPGAEDTGDPSDIWSHARSFTKVTNDSSANGGFIQFGWYSIQPEFNLGAAGDTLMVGIGVVTHEYGHQLGLPDLYDSSRNTWGIGYWGLMAYGAWGAGGTEIWSPSHLSAWCKATLGWVVPEVVTGNRTSVPLPPVETDPVVYKVWSGGAPGPEYFLLANRQRLGFDGPLPGVGLLIWHVDESKLQPTDVLELEQADGLDELALGFGYRPDPHVYHGELGDAGDPFPGSTGNATFDHFSNPNSRDNAGSPTNVSVAAIREEGRGIRCNIAIAPVTTAAGEADPVAGSRLRISPNPANPAVEITFGVSGSSPMTLEIVGVRGERVRLLRSGPGEPGVHRLAWDGRDDRGGEVASGVYFLRLLGDGATTTRKLVVLR